MCYSLPATICYTVFPFGCPLFRVGTFCEKCFVNGFQIQSGIVNLCVCVSLCGWMGWEWNVLESDSRGTVVRVGLANLCRALSFANCDVVQHRNHTIEKHTHKHITHLYTHTNARARTKTKNKVKNRWKCIFELVESSVHFFFYSHMGQYGFSFRLSSVTTLNRPLYTQAPRRSCMSVYSMLVCVCVCLCLHKFSILCSRRGRSVSNLGNRCEIVRP